MDRKDYAQAAAVLQTYMDEAGEAAPPQVWTYLGGALYQNGDVDKAARIFCSGHEVYPDNSLLCLNAGNTLYELERFAEAAPLLEKAYGLQQPSKPEWLYQAGAAYYQGKTFGESARVLQRLLKSTATPRKEWIRLAIHALLESGRAPEAESLLLNYLAISPQEADYWRLLAKLYMEREQFERAGAALEICYRLAPPSLNDMEQLASLYNYRNAPLLAASTLKTAYGQSPSREQTLRVAALLASAGRTSQAVDYLDTYLGAGQGALEKGKYLYGARRFEQAESEFRKLLSLEDQPEARFYLALCAWERTDWKAARRELERIAELKAFRAKTSSYLTVLADLDRADAVPLQ
jgi:tetratricopeptide (TPR) repeat protein